MGLQNMKWHRAKFTTPPSLKEVLAKTEEGQYLVAYYEEASHRWLQLAYDEKEPYPVLITPKIITWTEIKK